ncbi:MAG: YceI family protein [Chloroflexi bacterium]|nr:MAG: YceI family protein [Chloroflexota bacterium]
MRGKDRQSMKKLVIAGGAAIALAVAGVITAGAAWYFFIRENAELASDPPEIPAALLNATASPTSAASTTGLRATATTAPSASVTYQVKSNLSEADYFVDEELASVGIPSTAKGATTEVSGTLYLTGDGAALAANQTSSVTVQLRNLTSDKSMRDQRVQQALETSRYPTATFTITSASGYNPAIAEGQEQTLQLSGNLQLHGVTKPVTWEVKAYRQGNVISALATVTIKFSDFNITPPTFQGLLSISDQATLQVKLIAQAA